MDSRLAGFRTTRDEFRPNTIHNVPKYGEKAMQNRIISDERISTDCRVSVNGWYDHPNKMVGIGIVINDGSGDLVSEKYCSRFQDFSRFQLEVCAEVLRRVNGACKVIIATNAKFVVENVKENMYRWALNEWLNFTDGSPVKNSDLWKVMLKRTKKRQNVTWTYLCNETYTPDDFHSLGAAKKALEAGKQTLDSDEALEHIL